MRGKVKDLNMNRFHFLSPTIPDLLSLIIESERLRLETITERFDQDIFQEFTCEITRYMIPEPPLKIEETREFIAASKCGIKAGNNLQFVILSKATDEFLGCCGLHGRNKVRTPELGIWLKKSAHGNSYGREAIHTLIQWSRNNLDIDYFVYPVDRHNFASSKIPKSLGGEIVEALKKETPTGKILDWITYRIN